MSSSSYINEWSYTITLATASISTLAKGVDSVIECAISWAESKGYGIGLGPSERYGCEGVNHVKIVFGLTALTPDQLISSKQSMQLYDALLTCASNSGVALTGKVAPFE